MYRLVAIVSSLLLLLVASTTALTVAVDTATRVAPKGSNPIRWDIDPTASADSACCADYPFCGCPKLESPQQVAVAVRSKKKPFVRLPPAKQAARAKSDSPCCPDYPLCGCPKLEAPQTKSRIKVIHVGSAAERKVSPLMVVGAASTTKGTCNCCPDYPYCSCPKL